MSYDEHLISMAGGDGDPDGLDLDAIQARADAATEGPWRVRECPPCAERGRLEVNIWDQPGNLLITNWCDDDELHRPDAEFIAAARTDVPALLALVREQQARIGRVMAELTAREERWKAAWQCGELSHEEAVSATFEDRWAYAELAGIRAALTASEPKL